MRLVLAMSVVLDHSLGLHGFGLVGGRTAVECFFVISGFYMALVLSTKYEALPISRQWRTFMAARALRLYPIYVVVAVASAGLLVLAHHRGQPVAFSDVGMSSGTWLLVGLSNVTMVWQDVLTFGAINAGGGFFVSSDFSMEAHPTHFLLLVPQAWSLSLELYFYLLAPWLLRRSSRFLCALATMAVCLRVALVITGLGHDPWSYRLFPAELSLFLAGVLVYRAASSRAITICSQRWAFLLALGAITAFPLIDSPVAAYALPYAFALAVPAVFALTRDNRRDRWIGELSYPLYMVHVLVIAAMGQVHLRATGVLALGLSLIAALALMLVFERPLEHWRQVRVARALTGAAPREAPTAA